MAHTLLEKFIQGGKAGREDTLDTDTLSVYEWFDRWDKEFFYGFDENWAGFPVCWNYPENLALRMQRGRRAGEAPFAGSSTVWRYEQPPIKLPEVRIKECINQLVKKGLLCFETEKDSRGNVTEIKLWRAKNANQRLCGK